jgi:hypothetical protein
MCRWTWEHACLSFARSVLQGPCFVQSVPSSCLRATATGCKFLGHCCIRPAPAQARSSQARTVGSSLGIGVIVSPPAATRPAKSVVAAFCVRFGRLAETALHRKVPWVRYRKKGIFSISSTSNPQTSRLHHQHSCRCGLFDAAHALDYAAAWSVSPCCSGMYYHNMVGITVSNFGTVGKVEREGEGRDNDSRAITNGRRRKAQETTASRASESCLGRQLVAWDLYPLRDPTGSLGRMLVSTGSILPSSPVPVLAASRVCMRGSAEMDRRIAPKQPVHPPGIQKR